MENHLDSQPKSHYNQGMDTYNSIFSLIASNQSAAYNYLQEELISQGLEALSPIHGNILHALVNCHQLTLQELAAITRRPLATVTVLVQNLEQLGYVESSASPAVTPPHHYSITQGGLALMPAFEAIASGFISSGLDGLAGREKACLEAELKFILQNCE